MITIRIPRLKEPRPSKSKRVKFKHLYPEISALVMKEPYITDSELWNRFKHRVTVMRRESFIERMRVSGIMKIRKAARGQIPMDKQSEIIASEFTKVRQEKGMQHIIRMSKVLDKATDVIEEESNGTKPGNSLKSHLSNLSKLNDIARSVYALDAPAAIQDQAKVNIAILTNYNPDPDPVVPQKVIEPSELDQES